VGIRSVHQTVAAIATLVARMAAPGSEPATYHWLQHHSALGELIDYDFPGMDLKALYRISYQLLKLKVALEGFLYEISVEQYSASGKATAINWQRTTPLAETLPGVYCLRTNEA
jgi:hypothetical protein